MFNHQFNTLSLKPKDLEDYIHHVQKITMNLIIFVILELLDLDMGINLISQNYSHILRVTIPLLVHSKIIKFLVQVPMIKVLEKQFLIQ